MNKYFISGKLMHKASDHNTKRCEVEKWVFLPHSDFERLKSNPYQEHEAITAAKDLMYEDGKAYHCIMLLDEHDDDGLLIEAEGFDYPHLSMFVPDAALIYERYKTSEAELKIHDMIKETADKIAELAHTDKTYFTSADMIDMDEVESLVKNAIVQQLSQRDDIIMAKNTDIGVDFQPDIHVEAKKLTELKFYCPLKVQREIQPSFDDEEEEDFFEDTEECRMAKQLDIPLEEVIYNYGYVYVGQMSKIPLVSLRMRPDTNECPFLIDGRCKIHSGKPAVCALFPLGLQLRAMKMMLK